MSTITPDIYKFMPYVSLGSSVLWIVGTTLWCLHWIRWAKLRIYLQMILTMVPIAKLVSLVFNFIFYYDCYIYGDRTITNQKLCGSRPWIFVNRAFSSIYELSVFAALLLISKGWFITRRELDPSDKKQIVWNILLLAACNTAVQISNFFTFPLIVMYIIIFGHIYTSIFHNVKLLDQQMSRLAPLADNNRNLNPAYQKIVMLRLLQYIISGFLIIKVLIYMALIILTFEVQNMETHLNWIQYAAEELLQFGAVAIAGIVFRLRDFSAFNRFRGMAEEENVPEAQAVPQEFLEAGIMFEGLQFDQVNPQPSSQEDEYRPLLKLAEVPPFLMRNVASGEKPVLLVEHPHDTSTSLSALRYSIATEAVQPAAK